MMAVTYEEIVSVKSDGHIGYDKVDWQMRPKRNKKQVVPTRTKALYEDDLIAETRPHYPGLHLRYCYYTGLRKNFGNWNFRRQEEIKRLKRLESMCAMATQPTEDGRGRFMKAYRERIDRKRKAKSDLANAAGIRHSERAAYDKQGHATYCLCNGNWSRCADNPFAYPATEIDGWTPFPEDYVFFEDENVLQAE